jgi:hypothetical protein
MPKRPVNYRGGYSVTKSERTGFLISKDGKPVIVVKSMAAAYTWIDREVREEKEEQT